MTAKDSRSVSKVEARQRDAERSRKAILEAARALFAESGLRGTRLDHVAERAGLNPRLVYYYFGTKEQLYLTVLEHGYLDLRRAESELDLDSMVPIDAIRRLIEFSWRYYQEHPEFMALVNNENMHRAELLSGSQRIPVLSSPLLDSLGRILEQGRIEGVFRGGVDPMQLYFTLVSLTYFYFSNRYTLPVLHGPHVMAPKGLNERLSHITEVILGYLVR